MVFYRHALLHLNYRMVRQRAARLPLQLLLVPMSTTRHRFLKTSQPVDRRPLQPRGRHENMVSIPIPVFPLAKLLMRSLVTPRSRLINHVNLRTENGTNFDMDIPPSCIAPQQSVIISVPLSYNILYLRPTVVSSNLERQTQLTVTVGSQKISSQGPPVRSADATIPKYELRLGPGITKIDIEMYAAPGRGLVNLATPNGPGVEYEAFSIYVHVMQTG